MDRIAPGLDAEMATAMQNGLEKQSTQFRLGRKVTVGANAMAKARLEHEELMKVLANAKSGEILGVQILGPDNGSR